MNDNRIIMSLGAFILCMVFCLQASTIGCSKNNAADDESAGASTNQSAFFRDNEAESNEPIEWAPVADNVFAQVIEMHEDDPISIQAIDRNVSGPSAVRCVIESLDGNSVTRDLLNGFYLLYSDFPNQNTYIVELNGDSVRTTWDNLKNFAESGYTYDSSDLDLDWYWGMIVSEPVDDSPDVGVPTIEVQ
ncbi:MAG: hypothetical protein NTY09_09425 [bacterium]|nr:hypothetical protein [bacterium]